VPGSKKTYNNFMVLFLEVVSGPLAGSRYKIENGVTIGRSRADIVLEDPKISSSHASFAKDNKDQFVLNDLGSANGILSGNRRVRKLAMMPGVGFRLGSTTFNVVQVDEPAAENFARVQTWKEHLVERLNPAGVKNIPPKSPLLPFSPAITLQFTQGIQTGESIKLGYGPRVAGAYSLDVDLLDPLAAELVFELIPGTVLAKLKNLCGVSLKVNGKQAELIELQDGDLIQFATTTIKISYI
jgi:pSer/pThr/pTyr-binding forkhead associated (FHA) protein